MKKLRMMVLFVVGIFLIAIVVIHELKPGKVPMELRPPVTLLGAEQILRGDGWKITSKSADLNYGCIEAVNDIRRGKLCFHPCNGKSAAEIAQEIGATFGYQIGEMAKCDSYTTYEGAFEFVDTLAIKKKPKPTLDSTPAK